MVILIIIALIVGFVLTKLASKPKFGRFFLINIGVIVLYNLLVLGIVLGFYDGGEAGILLVFWDIVITCLHVVLLVIIAVVKAVKEQAKS